MPWFNFGVAGRHDVKVALDPASLDAIRSLEAAMSKIADAVSKLGTAVDGAVSRIEAHLAEDAKEKEALEDKVAELELAIEAVKAELPADADLAALDALAARIESILPAPAPAPDPAPAPEPEAGPSA